MTTPEIAPWMNFALYMAVTLLAWGVSVTAYVHITPYREFALVRAGNLAAACSLAGTGLGLALPLASLAAHAASLMDLLGWAVFALATQLALWWVLRRALLPDLKEQIVAGNTAVGLVLGALSLALGLINAACLIP